MTRKIRIILPVLIVATGFALMLLFISLKGDPPKKEMRVTTKVVDTDVVKLATIPAQIIAYGRVTSVQPVELYSEVSGVLMSGKVPFQPAQSFRKGDLLLKIDDRQAVLSLNSAKSDLLTALATLLPEVKVDFPEQFPIWYDYFNACDFDTPLSNLPEVDNQKLKLYLSRLNVYKLFYSVRDLEIRLSKHYFYAPFDGSISSTALRLGSTARVGSLLGKILNLEELEVEIPVPVEDIQWIDEASAVTLKSSEIDGEWTGRIARIGNTIDSRTQSIQVFIQIDSDQDFPNIVGVFFKAIIPGKQIQNAHLLPHRALYNEEYVYLISDGKLEYRQVEVARSENGSVILNGGLNAGDTLVIEAMQGVYPGMLAKPKVLTIESRVAE